MNQDFLLPATPAVARKLVRFADLTSLDLDPRIRSLAERDRVTADAFDPFLCPATPERIVLTQFLLDAGLRAGVVAPGGPTQTTILNAARLMGVEKVIIASRDPKRWKEAVAGSGLPKTAFVMLSHRAAFREEEQEGRRDGLMVLDWHDTTITFETTELFTAIAREFPRTVILADEAALESIAQGRFMLDMSLGLYQFGRPVPYVEQSSSLPWWELAAVLYPEMPLGHFTLGDRHIEREVMPRTTWGNAKRNDLAHFYNVFLPQNHAAEMGSLA